MKVSDILEGFDFEEILEYFEPSEVFEAIESRVRGGTDPQFNQAYNQWRHNKCD